MAASLNLLQYNYFANANGHSLTLVTAGAVVHPLPFDTHGANTYTVSVKGVTGDVFQIEGRLLGGDWYVVQAAINANQHYTFTGLYDELRIIKVSGSGTTASLSIRYGR